MAALLLKRAGHEVTGITMSLWDGSIALPESESSGCFGPGETREMALTFVVDREIGNEISELTLAYAFFLAPNPS